MTGVVIIVWPAISITNNAGTVAKNAKVLTYTETAELYLAETCLRN